MQDGLATARELDQRDPLRAYRGKFLFPRHRDGNDQLYFCGNSLGLQPKGLAAVMNRELRHWHELAVEGHFVGDNPWTRYPQRLQARLAALVGASPAEVAIMNTLTVNLHLLLISFFRPQGERRRILIEPQPFPSDRYALTSQLRLHGLDADECLVEFKAAEDGLVDEEDIEAWLEAHGRTVALVLWPGVQYATGQRFDLERIAAAAHKAGAVCGFDLAHSVGNVPVNLRASGADFAVWCTYKYMNAGPGAIGACFVNERHHDRTDLLRLNGWWGNDLESRFRMAAEFAPARGADAWQVSTPPTLAILPIEASLDLFEQAGMEALREKSVAMTGYLEALIQRQLGRHINIVTPTDPARRGCQLSLKVRAGRAAGRNLFERLEAAGTVPDWREPDIIRVAPVPFYNRFEDCWRFVSQVSELLGVTPA
ncbi:MAG: kynureninase [Lysobacterales bacterium]|jgi:kynureninase